MNLTTLWSVHISPSVHNLIASERYKLIHCCLFIPSVFVCGILNYIYVCSSVKDMLQRSFLQLLLYIYTRGTIL